MLPFYFVVQLPLLNSKLSIMHLRTSKYNSNPIIYRVDICHYWTAWTSNIGSHMYLH